MKIILLGYMGSGKSSVGRSLAAKLDIKFLDLDEEIVSAENKSISAIFEDSGEIYFRKAENAVLKRLLSSKESFVLSLGGGTPCYANNLEMILQDEHVKSLYLKTSLETLRERLWEERDTRPLISHLESSEALEDFIRKHLFERTYYYNQSEFTVTTDGKNVQEISSEVFSLLN
ncbi:shikimate kinase [Salinimicrobium sp. GXAS 041]|uniref:shikimate kinase n=1 Tax=Salinimicrobium sp. GXAS 041 TaxID=3400806 RepID=UPI003C78FBAD